MPSRRTESQPTISTIRPAAREIASGLAFPEGPIALADGSCLVTEIASGRLKRVLQEGKQEVIAELGGGPNGAALGPGGKVYVCNNGGQTWVRQSNGRLHPTIQAADYKGGSIQVVELSTGRVETLYDACEGARLRSPNDLVFDSAGGFWFTDFGKTRQRDMDRGAVFYAKADGSAIKEVIFPMEKPNGCALSPDQSSLYVAETLTGRLFQFALQAPGELAPPREGPLGPDRGQMMLRLPGHQLFDSMAVDVEGHVALATLLTGAISDVWPGGSRIDQYVLDDPLVTNVCFGGPELRTAFVTLSSTGRLVAFDWPRQGLPLPHRA